MINNVSPAFLCIGPQEEVAEFAVRYLQNLFCAHRQASPGASCRCATCHAITSHQSGVVTWIEPSADYLLEDIEPIFNTIRYRLDEGAQHAFVLANAHLLSVACANRLLKVVEEPPAGYFFIFLANDYAALLPTIQSRATVLYRSAHETPVIGTLLAYFIDQEKQQDPAGFDAFLRSETIGVGETKLMVHQLALLINYNNYKQPDLAQQTMDKAQRNFPQTGGCAHYLRWLFIALHTARFSE